MYDQNVLAMFGIAASMFVLYLLIWFFWLRLPVLPKGTPVYRAPPPTGLSPAAAEYLFKKEYDNVTFECAIANAGTKGFLSAKCLGKKVSVSKRYRSTSSDLWTVSRQDDYIKKDLSPDEEAALGSFFDYVKTVDVSQDNQKLFEKSLVAHEEHLKKKLDYSHLKFHPKLEIMVTIIYLICVSGMAWVIREINRGGGVSNTGYQTLSDMINSMKMELSFFGFSIIFILGLVGVVIFFSFLSIVMSWFTPQSSFSEMLLFGGEELYRTVGFILIGAVLCSIIWILLSPELIFFFLILRGLNRWFFAKTKHYTLQGRQIMDQLEDFQDYLLQRRPKDISSIPRESVDITFSEQWRPYAIALE